MLTRRKDQRRKVYRVGFDYIATFEDVVALVQQAIGILPDIGWAAGQGTTPAYWLGAANAAPQLATTGAPAPGTTPFVDIMGNAIASEGYGGADYRSTATVVDPAIGEDIVVIAMLRKPLSVGSQAYVSTRSAGAGWMVYDIGGLILFQVFDGVVSRLSNSALVTAEWNCFIGLVEGAGNLWHHINGSGALSILATPVAAAIGNAEGVGIAARPNGTLPMDNGGQVGMLLAYYGGDITLPFSAGGFDLVERINRLCAGWERCIGRAPLTYTRASSGTYISGGNVHLMGSGAPRSGGEAALLYELFQGFNNVYNNRANTVIGGWACTGGVVPARVSDLVELDAAGIRVGEWTIDCNNVTGAVQYLTSGIVTGAVTGHSLSVRLRKVAAGQVRMGLFDGAVYTNGAVLVGDYSREEAVNVTPANVNQIFCIEIAAGAHVRLTLGQMEDGATLSSEIVNDAVAAGATRQADIFVAPAESRIVVGAIDPGEYNLNSGIHEDLETWQGRKDA